MGDLPRDAARLAILLSPACLIERELVRAVRARVTPWMDAGAEADLWCSDWVARSHESITLRSEVLPGLRHELSSLLRDKPPNHPVHQAIRQAWSVIQEYHATMSPALRVEEVVTWATIVDLEQGRSSAAQAKIDLALQPILRALVDRERTDGILDWSVGAWQRLPDTVRHSRVGWQLAQVAMHRVPEVADRMAEPMPGDLWANAEPGVRTAGPGSAVLVLGPGPGVPSPSDVTAVLDLIHDVRIPVRHDGQTLSIGAKPGPGVVTIAVPDTRPRLLNIEWTSRCRGTRRVGHAPRERVRRVHRGYVVRLAAKRPGRGLPRAPPEPAPAPEPASSRSGSAQPPGATTRVRLARLGAQRRSGVNPALEPTIKTIRAHHPKADVRMVERAYEVAAYWHRDQKRKSGDPYITHPLAVATILADLGMNTETICAALLHDTVGDTSYTLAELRSEFGEDVAALVDGVTKLDKVKYGASAEAETVRKMVVAMSRDIRVLVIKLADRLHNTAGMTATFRATSRSASPARRWRYTRPWPTGST